MYDTDAYSRVSIILITVGVIRSTFEIFLAMIALRLCLFWFPSAKPHRFPFYYITMVVDPVLTRCNKIVPPLFGLDLSMSLMINLVYIIVSICRSLEESLITLYT